LKVPRAAGEHGGPLEVVGDENSAREGEFTGGGGDWSGERRKGGGRASDSGFIGRDEVL